MGYQTPGYENVTAEQARCLACSLYRVLLAQQQMDPSRLQAFMNQPSGGANSTALKPSNSRQAKRLFVSNCPRRSPRQAAQLFQLAAQWLNVVRAPTLRPGQRREDHSFALVEFKESFRGDHRIGHGRHHHGRASH